MSTVPTGDPRMGASYSRDSVGYFTEHCDARPSIAVPLILVTDMLNNMDAHAIGGVRLLTLCSALTRRRARRRHDDLHGRAHWCGPSGRRLQVGTRHVVLPSLC